MCFWLQIVDVICLNAQNCFNHRLISITNYSFCFCFYKFSWPRLASISICNCSWSWPPDLTASISLETIGICHHTWVFAYQIKWPSQILLQCKVLCIWMMCASWMDFKYFLLWCFCTDCSLCIPASYFSLGDSFKIKLNVKFLCYFSHINQTLVKT